jgi:hypothetical protein
MIKCEQIIQAKSRILKNMSFFSAAILKNQ